MRVQSKVVYKMKRRGPRIEPWGTPTRAGMRGRKTIFTFDTKTAIRQVKLKPFQDRPVKIKVKKPRDE